MENFKTHTTYSESEVVDKLKTFQVTGATHGEVVKYCNEHSLKVNAFVDKLLLKTIRSLNEREKAQHLLQNDQFG